MNTTKPEKQNQELVHSWKPAQDHYKAGNREWLPCTEDFYYETLCSMPPIYVGKWWGNSEPATHNGQGEPVYLFCRAKPVPACRMASESEILNEQVNLENQNK